jgi:hypothetical protein
MEIDENIDPSQRLVLKFIEAKDAPLPPSELDDTSFYIK